jgi:hypothetical protein
LQSKRAQLSEAIFRVRKKGVEAGFGLPGGFASRACPVFVFGRWELGKTRYY